MIKRKVITKTPSSESTMEILELGEDETSTLIEEHMTFEDHEKAIADALKKLRAAVEAAAADNITVTPVRYVFANNRNLDEPLEWSDTLRLSRRITR